MTAEDIINITTWHCLSCGYQSVKVGKSDETQMDIGDSVVCGTCGSPLNTCMRSVFGFADVLMPELEANHV